jgi:anaerobic ribonucleoside-triphosphate reductase activating protein
MRKRLSILKLVDIFVDGEFINDLKDTSLHWVGSSNQRVIDMKATLVSKSIVEKG